MTTNNENKQVPLTDDQLDDIAGGIIRGTGVGMMMSNEQKGAAITPCPKCSSPMNYQGIVGGRRMFTCNKCSNIIYLRA
ncbi:MAG: hypothetical protein Q4B54_07910 [Coriobacteriales bacterium]|nr:hypothetical protein [Coriobacteriales bacterium]